MYCVHSFSWLSWLVHRNLAFVVKGSAVTHFLQEFERLSSCSTTLTGFQNVPYTLPIKTRSRTITDRAKGKTTSDQTDNVCIWDWIEDGLNSHRKERTQRNILTPQDLRPLRQPVLQHMYMDKFTKSARGGTPVQDEGNVLHKLLTPGKPQYQNKLASFAHSAQNHVNQSKTGQNVVVIKGMAHPKSVLLGHGQEKTVSSSHNKTFNNPHVTAEDYWPQRQNGTIMAPPGIAAGINKLREERNTLKLRSNPTNNSKIMNCFRSNEKLEKQGVRSSVNGAQRETYGLHNTAKSTGMKTLTESTRNHLLPSQTMLSPNTTFSAQPQLRSNFSPTTRINAAAQQRPPQVNPSSRLSWMSQNNTVARPLTRPVSFYSYDTAPKMDGQRPFHTASAKPLARSRSMTERPATHCNFK